MAEVKLETGRFEKALRESKGQFDAEEVQGWGVRHPRVSLILGVFDVMVMVMLFLWIVRHW